MINSKINSYNSPLDTPLKVSNTLIGVSCDDDENLQGILQKSLTRIEKALDGTDILQKTPSGIVCKFCSAFCSSRGRKANYCYGAHQSNVTHITKHLATKDHRRCEEKWRKKYAVCLLCYFIFL
jgi:hypothetical protein